MSAESNLTDLCIRDQLALLCDLAKIPPAIADRAWDDPELAAAFLACFYAGLRGGVDRGVETAATAVRRVLPRLCDDCQTVLAHTVETARAEVDAARKARN